MKEEHAKQAATILTAMRRHPRIIYQKMASTDAQITRFRDSLPFFIPFNPSTYYGFLPILDWDHRLPSRVAILRIYAYYSEITIRAGEAEYQTRHEQIRVQDKFPEFDVPDYAGIMADESYEGEVDPKGNVLQVRLVSSWRRDIGHSDARASIHVARRSEEFRQVVESLNNRPDYLGDLEAVSWTPPCESLYSKWTIDVWYLMDLNGSTGKGRSFLIDLESRKVVGVREFVVRSG
jgi:hypothetical protein